MDVANIVPSTRDLLQAIATRRKRLAIVAILEASDAAEDAARLDDLSVAAFACAEPGPVSEAAAAATKSVPVLSLAEACRREDALAARAHRCDGACVLPELIEGGWHPNATILESTRMLPVAIVTTPEEIRDAVDVGAKAALLTAPSVAEALAWAISAPKTLTLVALVEAASLDDLRALANQVDAVCVTEAQHRDPGFAAFVAAVDP